ncbi:hypothetical protein [Tateyamaria sp. 1078]|uniref:hypothetical protein n=1 Tax=Tateyamaria sp. 1078 TaxID=3417464 RepID=UPI003EBB5E5D
MENAIVANIIAIKAMNSTLPTFCFAGLVTRFPDVRIADATERHIGDVLQEWQRPLVEFYAINGPRLKT